MLAAERIVYVLFLHCVQVRSSFSTESSSNVCPQIGHLYTYFCLVSI